MAQGVNRESENVCAGTDCTIRKKQPKAARDSVNDADSLRSPRRRAQGESRVWWGAATGRRRPTKRGGEDAAHRRSTRLRSWRHERAMSAALTPLLPSGRLRARLPVSLPLHTSHLENKRGRSFRGGKCRMLAHDCVPSQGEILRFISVLCAFCGLHY